MSTTATIPEQTTNAVIPVKREKVNYVVAVTLDEHGKIKDARATAREKDISNLKSPEYPKTEKEKANPETIAFEQTVIKSTVGSFEGFEQLIPDADVRLDIVNIGLRAKFTSKIVQSLTELDEAGNLAFQPVEPEYDATPLLQAVSERVVLSPQDRAMKLVRGADLALDDLNAIIAQMQAIVAAKTAAAAAAQQ